MSHGIFQHMKKWYWLQRFDAVGWVTEKASGI